MIIVTSDKSGFVPKEEAPKKPKEKPKAKPKAKPKEEAAPKTMKALKAAAKEAGVTGYSKMKREDLEKAIADL